MSISILKVGAPSLLLRPTKTNTSNTVADNRLAYLKLDKPIVFYDLETTGLEGNSCRVVQISLVKIYPTGDKEKWTSYIDPEIPIPPEVTKIHSITDKDVKNSPTFRDIAPELKDFIGDSHLGGYNIINFDYPVLKSEFKRAGLDLSTENRTIIDPVKIFHRFVPAQPGEKGSKRLIHAYEYYCGKKLEKQHTADGDINATIEVLEGQIVKHRNELPSDVYELGKLCREKQSNSVDTNGKLVWRKNQNNEWEVVLNYMAAEHRGKTLKEVIEKHMDYINWALYEPKEYDYEDEVKNIIKEALKGNYPQPPN